MSQENCPFCQTEIKSGAYVCSACGAYESSVASERGVGIFILMFLIGLLFTWAGTVGRGSEVIMITGFGVLLIVVSVLAIRKCYNTIKWYRWD